MMKRLAESEKERALAIIEKYKRELYNNSMLIKIEKQIDHMEEQKRRLKVQGAFLQLLL